jgi:hypothetical protein
MMEALRTSETTVYFNEPTQWRVPECCNLHTRRRENLQSHITFLLCSAIILVCCTSVWCRVTLRAAPDCWREVSVEHWNACAVRLVAVYRGGGAACGMACSQQIVTCLHSDCFQWNKLKKQYLNLLLKKCIHLKFFLIRVLLESELSWNLTKLPFCPDSWVKRPRIYNAEGIKLNVVKKDALKKLFHISFTSHFTVCCLLSWCCRLLTVL